MQMFRFLSWNYGCLSAISCNQNVPTTLEENSCLLLQLHVCVLSPHIPDFSKCKIHSVLSFYIIRVVSVVGNPANAQTNNKGDVRWGAYLLIFCWRGFPVAYEAYLKCSKLLFQEVDLCLNLLSVCQSVCILLRVCLFNGNIDYWMYLYLCETRSIGSLVLLLSSAATLWFVLFWWHSFL